MSRLAGLRHSELANTGLGLDRFITDENKRPRINGYVSANHPHGFRLLTIEVERERGIYYFKGLVNVPREAVHSFR